MIWTVVIAGCLLLGLLFVTEPLVRDDARFADSWPETTVSDAFEPIEGDARTDRHRDRPDGVRQCHSCGEYVDEAFTYCEDCLTPTT